MQIGEVAQRTGISSKMIRHYESIGLVPKPDRRQSNYRDYGDDDLHRLGFVARARDLGFSIPEIRDLLRLWADKSRASAEVKKLTEDHIAELDKKIEALREMRETLSHLASQCGGNDRPHCPIIENLAGDPPHSCN
ncbi:MAG: Cu(I)-responsive transcriptional regulator [Hyphomicrobiaceae bacterium]|nr:Cu(I)-responsive transcriptional regulator [Hyphomicrobiaceae bacterium]MCC0025127.1 Cu(I)-responsive transcriptional regulator [Hyphomicrobiaceae bacterium]